MTDEPASPLPDSRPPDLTTPPADQTETILPPFLSPAEIIPEPVMAAAPTVEDFTFHGDAAEFFRIWIVNTLLTLLSAGVFSAWAKVRKRRYLRGNTEFMGHRFDYRADPRRILIGNIVVALLFVAYMVFGEVYPSIRIAAVSVAVLLMPWIVVRSLAFNAHNTVYRGMRFYFHQTYGTAAMTYLAQAVVVVVSLGVYYPAWIKNRRAFAIGNHRLGDAFFRFNGKNGPFYVSYLVAGLLVAGASTLGGMMTAGMLTITKHKVASLTELLPFFAIYGLVLFISKHYLFARLFNHVWNHTQLDDHRFCASMDTSRWLQLQLVNLGAVIISCGLLYPWAVIRSTRYALSCLHFDPCGSIDRIARLGNAEGSAFSETAGEFIGMDFGL
jgi:uncharacterized membrane protein YjgN (DUF898 family)